MSRIAAVWRRWATKQDDPKTALAIGHRGAVIFRDAIGMKASERVNLASLSKAIAAVCLGHMMAERKLSLDLTLSDLASKLSKVDLDIPPHARRMTTAQLITHTSGMNPDITQSMRELHAGRNDTGRVDIRYANKALTEYGVSGRRGKYFYNNGNYAVMGALMAALTEDLEYETDCREKVLTPAGAPDISYTGYWGGLGAWGGWHGSAEQYLKFGMSHFGAQSLLAKQPRTYAWTDVAPEEGYGMGMGYYGTKTPYFISHHGTICSRSGIKNTSTIFFINRDGWTVSFNAAHCMDDDQEQLHDKLVAAAN